MRRWITTFARYDWSLLIAAMALTAIGVLVLFGIGLARESQDLFQVKKQLLGAGIGLALAVAISLTDYRHLRALALPIYAGGLALLVGVLVLGTTHRNGGRWFVLGALSFQPVELAKLTFVIFLAAYFSRHAHTRLTWTAFAGSAFALLAYVVPVLFQPDFGSAMVFIAIWLAMTFFCRLPRHAWWSLLLTFVTIATFLWMVGLKPYQRERITTFFSPYADPYGASYNVAQARIAIGSGGWFGKGIGEGSQARLRFLPEASTDFIFAVVGEELGFVGVSVVLFLLGLLLTRIIRIAMESQDAFAGLCLIGIASVIAFHLFVNAGMNLGIMPVTGIPLPFVSAAASSLIVLFLSIGIVEAVAVHVKGTFA